MKKVTNWQKATVFDCESDGLLEEATKYHVLSFKMHGKEIHSIRGDNTKRLKDFFLWHMNNGIPLVAHNAISFDIPLAEKLLELDLSSLMVVDTLFLSWYLNTSRRMHGLGTFLEDYGVEKPEVEDWENLTYEEYEFRCSEDVKINHLLWEDLKGRLEEMYTLAQEQIDSGNVGGKRMYEGEVIHLDRYVGGSVTDAIDRIITYLMFKADCVALQEKTGWKVDEEYLDKSLAELTSEMDKSRAELESVMPEIPEYRVRKKPAKPFKKDGSLSASGTTWKELNEKLASGEKDEKGTPVVERTEKEGELRVLFGYKPPNANSSDQVKDFLFSKGWVPQTFKYVRDEKAFEEWVASKPKEGAHFSQWNEWKERRPKDRAIPQISKDGGDGKEICHSVELLSEEVPEIMLYSRYNVIKHRVGVLEGFKSNMRNGKLQARVNGLTNTLRMQHSEIVNLPGTGRMFGEVIRGCLVAGEGMVSVGSDLSSLEDRCKHHFMLPHDPEYVSTMQDDNFDPHLSTALFAGLLTQKEFDMAMQGEKTDNILKARQAGKSCLPVDNTEVLTGRGWINGKDVVIGDTVMSLNKDKGVMEWCKVTDTILLEGRETVIMSNHNWTLESTPDHRWIAERRAIVNGDRVKVREFVETSGLNTESSIVTTAPYFGSGSSTSVAQARVMGWVLADGSLEVSKLTNKTSQGKDGRRQAVKMSVAQSKFYSEVKRDLDEASLRYGEYLNASGVPVMSIKSYDAREMLKEIGLPLESKHDIDYSLWLTSLSRGALEGFFDAFWKADGNTARTGTRYGTKIVYQNSGNIADAVQLASVLLGRNTFKKFDKNGYGTIRSQNRDSVTMQRVAKKEGRVTDVFCLTTENTSFLIRQNGFVTITGNCNYASVYGAGAPTIARAAGVDNKTGEKLHEGYWKLNWSVKAIAEEQAVVEDSRGQKWLINPINGFCYSLRKEADRFSTLAQGTGAFIFDMWLDKILIEMENRWGGRTLTAQFHDEHIFVIKDSDKFKSQLEEIIQSAIGEVNEHFMLRRKMGCETQFGQRYSEIH